MACKKICVCGMECLLNLDMMEQKNAPNIINKRFMCGDDDMVAGTLYCYCCSGVQLR